MAEYDTVIAVTQIAVNNALTEWMEGQQKQVGLYYTLDSAGNFVKSTKDDATVVFEGTLAPPEDAHGKPIRFVTLRSPKGPQTVQYNVIWRKALFECRPLKVTAREQEGEPWVMSFDVDLALEDSVLEKLPKKVREEIERGIENFDEDTFSVQRLWADLTTAALSTSEGIEGIPAAAKSLLEGLIKQYLVEQQEAAGMIFGVAVVHKGATAPPTFAPTALDFCVTPYQGAEPDPDLDTLNYLLMTGGRALPAYPPQSFPFNWVEDPSVAGAVAIRAGLIDGFLNEQLEPILTAVSPTIVCDAAAHERTGEVRAEPAAAGRSFTATEPSSANGATGTYEYAPGAGEDESKSWSGRTTVKATYSSWVKVFPGRDLKEAAAATDLLVRGEIALWGKIVSTGFMSRSTVESELPRTTWGWGAVLRLAADISSNGQLDLLLGEKEFERAPAVEKHERSWLEEFLAGAAHQFRRSVDDLSGIRSAIGATTLPAIQKSIEATTIGPKHFVFPGAKTFLFSNPRFTADGGLRTEIAYQGAE